MDLSHWDFAEIFSGYEAAALILGFEPRESQDNEHRIRVVAERLERDYLRAVTQLHGEFMEATGYPFAPDDGPEPRPPDILPSIQLELKASGAILHARENAFTDWLSDKRRSHFDSQTFDRKVVAGWLKATGLKSVYAFSPIEQTTKDSKATATRWPWGDHHTDALGHLEAAARRFWGANYDPSDPTTAATNAQVADWLKSERGVSGKLAESIASILRADNLRTGPR